MPPDTGRKPADNGAAGAGPAAAPGLAGAAVRTVAGARPAAGEVASAAPVLTVVKGSPTTEEIVAVVVVLATRTAPATARAVLQRPRSQWSSRSRLLREPVARQGGGWRASALPR